MDIDFLTKFKGAFSGILRWPQLDSLWERVYDNENLHWYIYQIGEPPPTQPVSKNELIRFINHLDTLLRTEHAEEYCGIVYADNTNNPSFIKIYDPSNLGVVCGFSEQPPLPGWIISTIKPVDLPAAHLPTQKRKRWFRSVFSR